MRVAGVADDKIRAVIDYLRAEFPGKDVNYIPEGDKIAYLFRILNDEVCHQLLVRRRFFDDYGDAMAVGEALRLDSTASKMRRVGNEIVELPTPLPPGP